MQETLHGSSRQARDFRDVFERKVLLISQRDHFGVLRAQVVNSLLQDLRQLPPFRDAVRRVLIASLGEAVLRSLLEGVVRRLARRTSSIAAWWAIARSQLENFLSGA